MGCYRRLIHDAFRRCNRNIEKSVSRNSSSSRSDPRRSRISQPIFRNSVLQKKCPQFNAKRFYNSDRNKVRYKQWYENPRNVIAFFNLSSVGVVIIVYYWNLETVPYTKRRHFIFVSPNDEKRMGELVFEHFKSKERFKGIFLDSDHPESIRVEKIGQDIIEGLRKGLNKLEDGEQTAHLEEFKWEVSVVNDPTIFNAVCLPGGKIVVFTGLLNYFKTDDEIANIIGHEVGHAVARHTAEQMSSLLPFSSSSKDQRFEMEADYIGLLISASAGYDPRIAPEVYVKLEEHSPSVLDVNLTTHPHGKKRAELLSQPKVMEEALSIYTEALKEKVMDKKN